MHDVDQVAEIAAAPIKFPDNQGVALAERSEICLKAGAVVEPTARGVVVETALGNTGRDKRVAPEVSDRNVTQGINHGRVRRRRLFQQRGGPFDQEHC